MNGSIHATNNQHDKMKEYKTIAALKNLNDAADRIEINYNKLDSKSAGALKDTIANTLRKITDIDDLNPKVKEYAEKLKKQNMTYSIDIDYSKIDDQEYSTAYLLKLAIQKALTDRKRELYVSLTLNANY